MTSIRSLLFSLALLAPALHAHSCPVSEEDLLGSWTTVSDQGFFETFSLTQHGEKNRLHSWLHQRPERVDATWKIQDCQLLIASQHNEIPPVRLRVHGLHQNQLFLSDGSDKLVFTYKRLR